jgi:hypothetical protein
MTCTSCPIGRRGTGTGKTTLASGCTLCTGGSWQNGAGPSG